MTTQAAITLILFFIVTLPRARSLQTQKFYYNVEEGLRLKLQCPVSNIAFNYTVVWETINGTLLSHNDTGEYASLNTEALNPASPNKTYVCRIFDENNNQTEIRKEYEVKFVSDKSSRQKAVRGQYLKSICPSSFNFSATMERLQTDIISTVPESALDLSNRPLTQLDSGTYICRLVNYNRSYTSLSRVQLIVEPQPINISATWSYDNVTAGATTTYTCFIRNIGNLDMKNTSLSLKIGNQITFTWNRTAESRKVTCCPHLANHPIYLEESEHQPFIRLTFYGVQANMNSLPFVCSARSANRKGKNITKLTVTWPAKIRSFQIFPKRKPNSKHFQAGDIAIIECQLQLSSAMNISGKLDGQLKISSKKKTVFEEIPCEDCRTYDEGGFPLLTRRWKRVMKAEDNAYDMSCHFNNSTKTRFLIVKYGPKLLHIAPASGTEVVAGSRIECAYDGDPIPNIAISIYDHDLTAFRQLNSTNGYVVQASIPQNTDSGPLTVQCVAKNKISTTEKHWSLKIGGKLAIIEMRPSNDSKVTTGSEIFCAVTSYPAAHVYINIKTVNDQWTRLTEAIGKAETKIPNNIKSGKVLVQCEAKNSINSTERTVELLVSDFKLPMKLEGITGSLEIGETYRITCRPKFCNKSLESVAIKMDNKFQIHRYNEHEYLSVLFSHRLNWKQVNAFPYNDSGLTILSPNCDDDIIIEITPNMSYNGTSITCEGVMKDSLGTKGKEVALLYVIQSDDLSDKERWTNRKEIKSLSTECCDSESRTIPVINDQIPSGFLKPGKENSSYLIFVYIAASVAIFGIILALLVFQCRRRGYRGYMFLWERKRSTISNVSYNLVYKRMDSFSEGGPDDEIGGDNMEYLNDDQMMTLTLKEVDTSESHLVSSGTDQVQTPSEEKKMPESPHRSHENESDYIDIVHCSSQCIKDPVMDAKRIDKGIDQNQDVVYAELDFDSTAVPAPDNAQDNFGVPDLISQTAESRGGIVNA